MFTDGAVALLIFKSVVRSTFFDGFLDISAL